MLSLTMPFKQTDDDGFCHVSDKHSLMTSGEGGITKAYVSAHLGRCHGSRFARVVHSKNGCYSVVWR